jgi:hypothetical protein
MVERDALYDLQTIIGEVYDEAAGGQHVNLWAFAQKAMDAVRHHFALLAVGDTITLPTARVVVTRGDDGFAKAVLEASE